jgi:hypothetical protein
VLKLTTHYYIASMNYFDSNMSNSTYNDSTHCWKTVMYVYGCGQGHTQFMWHYSPFHFPQCQIHQSFHKLSGMYKWKKITNKEMGNDIFI